MSNQILEHQVILFDEEGKDKLQRGIDLLADAVQVTLGPGGRHVAFQPNPGQFAVTKDGVTVAKSIKRLPDPFENIGSQMVRQASQKTAEVAGDGTTTATVLARAMFTEGRKAVQSGVNVIELKKEMEEAVSQVKDMINKRAKPCKTKKDLTSVATISTNGDKVLGKMIAEAKYKLGDGASITVELGRQAETTIEYIGGLRYDAGFASNYFVTNQRSMKVELDEPYIMVVDYKIHTIHEMVDVTGNGGILNEVAKSGRPLLILMKTPEAEVINTLAINNRQGTIKVCVTGFPFGAPEDETELCKDLAALTGATVLGHSTGVDVRSCNLSHLGGAKRVIVTRNDTTVVGGHGTKEQVETRLEQLEDFYQKLEGNILCERSLPAMRERISRLRGGIALIRAGGTTELEMRETKDRIDDAVAAVQAASSDGIVIGGGNMLRLGSEMLPTGKAGFEVIKKALVRPYECIAKNAGIVLKKDDNLNPDYGLNAATNRYENLFETGIIDPVKVVITALSNAVSIATLLLTTESIIVTDYDQIGKDMSKE